MSRFSALLVGVGGQGLLTAAQILGAAAHAAALPVVVGQLHGMSQRGGTVRCTVLIGGGESSFLTGECDVLVAFEALEALRALDRVGPRTRVLLNVDRILPVELLKKPDDYPSTEVIVAELGRVATEIHTIEGSRLMRAVGEPRTLNVALLGAAAELGLFPIPEEVILDAALARSAPAFVDPNRRAFAKGRDAVRAARARSREASL